MLNCLSAIDETMLYSKKALIVFHNTFLCLSENIKIRRHSPDRQQMKSNFSNRYLKRIRWKAFVTTLLRQ